MKHAQPRFPEHLQPNVPLWGYEMDNDPTVMAKKIDAAAEHDEQPIEDDEDFREEAVVAYIVKYEDSEALKDAAAEKYKEEHEDDESFREAAARLLADVL